MKIFDCFMYFDEEQVLDLRLNVLYQNVDYFVIVESIYNHKGEKRNLLFNSQKFEKFNDKIIYLVYDKIPQLVEPIKETDNEKEKDGKYIMNALYRENAQRDFILEGLKSAKKDDLILISDVDEIPNLESIDFRKIKNKIVMFEQNIFYYKLNRYLPNFKWFGTKACKKKDLINPQWLRNVKSTKYPFFRIDTFFSNSKYTNKFYVKNGGWHFSNLKNSVDIELKLKSYLHHHDYESEELGKEKIEELIKNNSTIYDMFVDKTSSKYDDNSRKKLEKFEINKLPLYIQKNLNKFKDWVD